MDTLLSLILDESKWLTFSLALALVISGTAAYRHRVVGTGTRDRILAVMNLFFALTIGTMAFGHQLAVTVKLMLGTLEGSALLFYLIGAAIGFPSWWLIIHSWGLLRSRISSGRPTLLLNAGTITGLLVLGIHNLPLAATGFLNAAYQWNKRPGIGWMIVGLAVIVNLGLLAGSLVFLASGQTFEQFRGME